MNKAIAARWGALAFALVFVPANLVACIQKADSIQPRAALTAHSFDPATDEEDPHADIIRNEVWPSARKCAACHREIYDEWASSAHAYSGLSPMFHKFEQKLNDLAVGTVNAFCVRCHLPVGTAAGQPREMTLYDREQDFERFEDPYVVLEGVTCIACHRVSERYGRVNGQRFIERGTVFDPVYGTREGEALDKAKALPEVAGDREEWEGAVNERGEHTLSPIHGSVTKMGALQKSEFCMSCHQVAVHPGIKLEVVWDQYLASPAHADGAQCQDCHMGKTPGRWVPGDENYERYPRAKVLAKDLIYLGDDENEVLHKNHSFVGPGYSIAHPGIFPHQITPLYFKDEDGNDTDRVVTLADWMQFANDEGWGESTFEEDLRARQQEDPTAPLPEFGPWSNPADRRAARERVRENEATLAARKIERRKVMENGSHIDGPFFARDPRAGKSLKLHYDVTNTCEGHNFPSGSLGAQPQVWLNVVLIGPDGERKWESGYVDDTGDIADLHSQAVLDGDLAHDDQLFNLQTKFLTTNVKGTDREMYLPVNMDQDQIPFIRPAGVPSTVLNHPPFIRMEQHSLPPNKTKKAKYKIPASALEAPGTYKLAVRLRSRAEPIYFMNFVGSTDDMKRRMNERMVDIHSYTVEFEVAQ